LIATKKPKKEPTPYRDLAEYIAEAKDPGEKLEELWIVNTHAGETLDDLEMAILEVDATQALNTRVKSNKHYHLIVSFRDEHPSPEALRDIDREFAKALGFEEHPRVVGTHVNTDNFHMHIGYSRIHPKTLLEHSPQWDYPAMEKVCRSMEQKHGLKVDLGRADKQEANRKPKAAQDMEAHSWEQSFYSYVHEHKEPLLKAKEQAKDWQGLHKAFGEFDLVLRKRGNGLIIGSGDGKQRIKASDLDRSFSKAALEKKFGPYKRPERTQERAKPSKRYKRRPVTRHKGQGHLWRRYMGARKGKDSLSAQAFKTWRDFLLYGAMDDPLAMAIIHAQKQFLKTISLQNVPPSPQLPKAKRPKHSKGRNFE